MGVEEYRLLAIGIAALSIFLWGSMTYLVSTNCSIYRTFWIICAVIAIASYVVLFGPTTFYVESSPIVFDSSKETQTQDFDVNGRNLYQHPWLIYKLYEGIFTDIRETVKNRKCDPLLIGTAILSITLPAAIFVSLHFSWKPIRRMPSN